MTNEDRRRRIQKCLKTIEERQEEFGKLGSGLREIRRQETELTNTINALRDQVKKDLTALDPGLTS